MNGKIVKFAKKILKPIRNSLYFKRVTDAELIDAFQREKCEKYLARRYKKLLQSPKKILEETKPLNQPKLRHSPQEDKHEQCPKNECLRLFLTSTFL